METRRKFLAVLVCVFSVGIFVVAGTPAQAVVIVIDSVNDGEIDGHVNWNNDPKGISGVWTTAVDMVVGRLGDDYGSPMVGPSMWGGIKFDVSGLVPGDVTGATLRLIQTASVSKPRSAPLAPTTDVYAITGGGGYDEATTSWNNFTGTADNDSAIAAFIAANLTYLGTMNNVATDNVTPGQVTLLNDVDLTATVLGWVDGSLSNKGLILLNPASLTGAPAGPADISARYATHESTVFDAPQLIIPEPASLSLLLFGGLALIRRRK